MTVNNFYFIFICIVNNCHYICPVQLILTIKNIHMETVFIIKAFIVAAIISLFTYLYRGVLKEKDHTGFVLLTFTAILIIIILVLMFTYK